MLAEIYYHLNDSYNNQNSEIICIIKKRWYYHSLSSIIPIWSSFWEPSA